jgi:hypothetical protein
MGKFGDTWVSPSCPDRTQDKRPAGRNRGHCPPGATAEHNFEIKWYTKLADSGRPAQRGLFRSTGRARSFTDMSDADLMRPREGDPEDLPISGRMTIPVHARKAFYGGIVEYLHARLPRELREFRHRGDFNLMKVWFDHYRVHYEVVIDQQINKIELGLHFEDGPASSSAFLALLDRRILEIKDRLGPGIELERWTQSWVRIYELRPLTAIDDAVTQECADRLALMIGYLQPIIAESGIPLERPGA